jgi:hypothetical protein
MVVEFAIEVVPQKEKKGSQFYSVKPQQTTAVADPVLKSPKDNQRFKQRLTLRS